MFTGQLRGAETPAAIGFAQKDIKFDGHAIECRINAENPATFRPSPGKILSYHPPGGLGVRVDSAVYQGYDIPPFYDSLVGKLIVHGKTRNECVARLKRALDEFVIGGIDTTLPLFRTLVRNQDIIDVSTSIFANFAAVQAASHQVGADVLIGDAAAANNILLTNFTLANLTADDFRFH